MKYVVYKITNKNNERKYYGVSQEYEKRIRSHRNQLRLGVHNNLNLQKDWELLGENSFEFKIVKVFDTRTEAENYEIDMINSDSHVYNIVKDKSVGGDYFSHNPRKEEIRSLKRKQMSGENNHQYGKPKTERMIQAVKKANSKPVLIEGVKYSSIAEASRKLGVKKTTVGYRLNSPSPRFENWMYV